MNVASRAPQLLSSQSIGDLLNSVEAFLFDCDGVIWKGDTLIDGVPQTLDMLRSKGKKLVFVTNNSTKSRRQYANKFQSLGISVTEDEIFSSSFAAGMFLKVNNFPKEIKVYVIGGEGILEELELVGYTGLGGPEDGKKTAQWKTNCLFEHDKTVGAVVVGLDPCLNYYKLHLNDVCVYVFPNTVASHPSSARGSGLFVALLDELKNDGLLIFAKVWKTLCVRENPGCLFIATNRDAVGHMTDLQEWPGAGCMVAAMCGSTEKEPIVVGKPSTFLMDFLQQKFQISCPKMWMVGDRLDTDILFAQIAGCKALHVLSGVTSQSTLQDP